MKTIKRYTPGALLICLSVFALQSCAPSNSALSPRQPHIYQNSYHEVLKATEKALTKASMKISVSKSVDADTYVVEYFQQRYDIQENEEANPGLTARVTIQKLSEDRTKVTIKEDQQSSMVPGAFKSRLGRDFLRQLNPLLNHVSTSKIASSEQ